MEERGDFPWYVCPCYSLVGTDSSLRRAGRKWEDDLHQGFDEFSFQE